MSQDQLRAVRSLAALVAIVLTAGCGVPSDPPFAHPHSVKNLVRRLAGCWQFESLSGDSPYLERQLTVRLDTTARSHHPDLLTAAVDTPLAARVRDAYWAIAVDSTRLVAHWGDGFTGLHLHLRLRADTLRGRAYRLQDVVPFVRSSIRVTAWRVTCPSRLLLPPNQRLQRSGA